MGEKFRCGSGNGEETKMGRTCRGSCFSRRKSNDMQWLGRAVLLRSGAWKDWPRLGCSEVGRSGGVWGRRSKVLSKGNRGGRKTKTWLGCLGSLGWQRWETWWRTKWGEQMNNLSPVGFQCFKSLALLWDLYLFCLSTEHHNGLTTGLLKIYFS